MHHKWKTKQKFGEYEAQDVPQFFFIYHLVHKIVVHILPSGPQSRSSSLWSAVYPLASLQVHSLHCTPGLVYKVNLLLL